MASTMLVSRNEASNFLSPNHHQPPRTTTNFMGKIPFPNPNPNPNPNSNFTPHNNNHNQNHNNHFSRKQLNHQNGDGFLSPPANDDAGTFNHRKSNDASLSHYVSYDLTRFSKSEIRNLKARLMSELDKVRSLSNRIETGELRNVSNHTNNHNNSSKKRPFPVQQQVKEPKRGKQQPQLQPPQPAYVASPQLMKMCSQVLSKLMKQKSGYIFNEPVDVVGMGLHDYHTIVKRPMDLGTIKKNLGEKGFYRTPDEFAADVRLTFNNALMYNPKGHEVHSLAEKFLEKFEQYYRPVYHKFQFEKQQFLRQQKAEARPPPKEDVVVVVDEVQGNSWSKIPSPEPPRVESPPKKPEPRPEPRVVELPPRVEPLPPPRPEPRVEPPPRAEPPPPPPRPEPVSAPTPAPEPAHMSLQEAVRAGSVGTGRGSGGKLPKPKAKDPNKREMSMEEKHKLGAGLQSLPEEKMSQVIQIIRKRNGHLTQDGDEIELDIEAVDTETLWELDRFVTNYKKMVSKMRRQALMDMQNNNVGHHHHGDHDLVGVSSERVMETAKAVKRGGGDVGDEDVDIGGDEMPVQNFPPVEIDKDDDKNHDGGGDSSSSSSSSSGSDSSSSDSDSGSSSGSDSDVDDAQSRDNESKNVPQ